MDVNAELPKSGERPLVGEKFPIAAVLVQPRVPGIFFGIRN
jgi:hypothetical protein